MFYSPAHNAVIYETDRPLQLTAATQGAVRINGAYVAVPATLDNLQALKQLDLLTPGPMDVDGYDWPIRAPWKPLPHQKTTANFMVLHKRAFCLNGMGTMKTLSILWAADYLMEMERRKGRRLRALINAPLSTTHVVWSDTLFQNFMSRRTWVVLEGSAERRQKRLAKDVDFYIVNPDGLGIGVPSDPKGKITGLAADIAARTDIQLAIIDECRTYSDATTKRHRAARKTIAGLEYLWLLTGTPTPNGPLDAYGQAKLINGAFGESFKSYKNRVMMPVGPFKWLPRQGSADAARKMLTPAIRFAIEDCVDLPECTVQRREVALSSDQSKAYKELKAEACLMVKDGRMIQAVHQAALRMKLIQIACGCVYDSEHDSHELDASPRLGGLQEVINDCAEKIIVFAPLTNVLHVLYRELSKTETCAIINGQVSSAERTKLFRDFQDDANPLRVLIADPATMAHGVTLTAATVVVWYAPTDKTELYIQANCRIDRPGQTKTTTIVQLAATDIEREIYTRLENNQSLQGVILKLAEGRI
jgi:SNF2 family DNA or RNA helicase